MPCECYLAAYLGLWQLLGNSPRTVAFDIDRWANDSWGLLNIERDQISGTVAVAGDGSRATVATSTQFKHYFIPSGQWAVHSIYLRPADIAYQVDDQTKTTTILRCTCTWQAPIQPSPDQECKAAAKFHLGASVRIGSGVVAGVSVVRYRATGDKDRDEHEAAFAPRLGCDLLEERSATYNTIGLPATRFHYIVRSYLRGEPRKESFYPPLGSVVRRK